MYFLSRIQKASQMEEAAEMELNKLKQELSIIGIEKNSLNQKLKQQAEHCKVFIAELQYTI